VNEKSKRGASVEKTSIGEQIEGKRRRKNGERHRLEKAAQ